MREMLGKTVFQMMDNFNEAIKEGKQIIHDDQILKEERDKLYIYKQDVKEHLQDILPYLLNIVEKYVQFRMEIEKGHKLDSSKYNDPLQKLFCSVHNLLTTKRGLIERGQMQVLDDFEEILFNFPEK